MDLGFECLRKWQNIAVVFGMFQKKKKEAIDIFLGEY